MNNISVLYDFIIQEKRVSKSLRIRIMAEPDVDAPSSSSAAVELVAEGN